jgi:hypothetical protein
MANSCSKLAKCDNGPTQAICTCPAGSKDAKGDGQYCVVTFDMSSVFINDTVVNYNGAVDTVQDPMDAHASPIFPGTDFITQSFANQFGPMGSQDGLPDDAHFLASPNWPADSMSHPEVTLAWKNTDDGNNSRIIYADQAIDVNVTASEFSTLQVFGVGTNGSSDVRFTLTYDDSSTEEKVVTYQDWYAAIPGTGFALFQGGDRCRYDGTNYENDSHFAMWGQNVTLAAGKKLKTISIKNVSPNDMDGGQQFVLYGIVGW